jgi:predicted phosphodiesterase
VRCTVNAPTSVRLGVVSDIHGNVAALDAVLADGAALGVDRWWALGDLVLFGPRPVEVLERLDALDDVAYVKGNTDRYVVTGEQPHPHRTPADAVGDLELVERLVGMAGAIGWTRGALAQAGLLDALSALPTEQRTTLPDATRLLGVHASPGRDDGPGIDTDSADADLGALLAGSDADIVVGGHTHDPTDRVVDDVRALNPGSAGLPRRGVGAAWLMIDAGDDGIDVERRRVPFDVDAVVADLHQRGYPNAAFVESILRRAHPYAH